MFILFIFFFLFRRLRLYTMKERDYHARRRGTRNNNMQIKYHHNNMKRFDVTFRFLIIFFLIGFNFLNIKNYVIVRYKIYNFYLFLFDSEWRDGVPMFIILFFSQHFFYQKSLSNFV